MAKRENGISDHLPPDWDNWSQKEKENWLSYPDPWEKKKKKKRRSEASVGPAGRSPMAPGGSFLGGKEYR
jgi:hypothetical protein